MCRIKIDMSIKHPHLRIADTETRQDWVTVWRQGARLRRPSPLKASWLHTGIAMTWQGHRNAYPNPSADERSTI